MILDYFFICGLSVTASTRGSNYPPGGATYLWNVHLWLLHPGVVSGVEPRPGAGRRGAGARPAPPPSAPPHPPPPRRKTDPPLQSESSK